MYDPSSLDRDSILTDRLFGYSYEEEGFIAKKVVPVLPVPNDGGGDEPPLTFKETTLNNAPFRIPNADTDVKGLVTMIDIDHTRDLFEVDHKYLKASIDNIERGQVSFDMEAAKTDHIAENLNLVHERDVAATIFAAANYATGWKIALTAGGQFNDAASNPLSIIKTGIRKVHKRPNKIVFGVQAWDAFCIHEMTHRAFGIQGGAAGKAAAPITEQMVADYFRVKEVLVGDYRYDSSAPGQTSVEAFIWGAHVAILHQVDADSTSMKVNAHTIVRSQRQSEVFKWFTQEQGPRGTFWVKGGWNRAIIVKNNKMGYFIEDATPSTY